MAGSSKGYNKRVAVVYFSAALLIVSVGVRMVGSLMSESGEGLSLLDWVMIVGIGLEFVVLTMYAAFIWSQPDDEGGSSPQSGSMIELPLHREILSELQNTVVHLKETENTLSQKTESEKRLLLEISSELKKNEQSLLKTSQELAEVKSSLQRFIEGTIQEQVKNEVETILSHLVNSKMQTKPGGR